MAEAGVPRWETERTAEERGIHRVEWLVSPANQPSIAVARRLGMTKEGVLRGSFRYRGEHRDMEVWSVLAPEWRAAKGGLTAGGGLTARDGLTPDQSPE